MSERETVDVIYIQRPTIVEALRALTEQFEADDDLVLIGLWNIEPEPSWSADEGKLQVVVTRMAVSDTEADKSNNKGANQ